MLFRSPLAEQLVEKNISVMDDRGRLFTKENIKELRSYRDFYVNLAENGLDIKRIPSYGRDELKTFANNLDKELTRLKKIETQN